MTAKPQYLPAALVADVAEILSEILSRKAGPVEIDQETAVRAFSLAGLLLIELGVTPWLDPDDRGPAAEKLRDIMLRRETAIKTKPRRAV